MSLTTIPESGPADAPAHRRPPPEPAGRAALSVGEVLTVAAVDVQFDPDDPSDAVLAVTLERGPSHSDVEYTLTEIKAQWLRNALSAQQDAVDAARRGRGWDGDDQTEPTGATRIAVNADADVSVGAVEIRYSSADPSDAALAVGLHVGEGRDVVEYPLTEVKATRLRNALLNQHIAVADACGTAVGDDLLDGDAGWTETGSDNEDHEEPADNDEDDDDGYRRQWYRRWGDPCNLDMLIATNAPKTGYKGIPVGRIILFVGAALLILSAVLGYLGTT